MSGSASSREIAADSPSRIAWLSALTGGLLSVTVAIPPSASMLTEASAISGPDPREFRGPAFAVLVGDLRE
jgi:hypothetical protein